MKRLIALEDAVGVHPWAVQGIAGQHGPVVVVPIQKHRPRALGHEVLQRRAASLDMETELARCDHIDDVDAHPTALRVEMQGAILRVPACGLRQRGHHLGARTAAGVLGHEVATKEIVDRVLTAPATILNLVVRARLVATSASRCLVRSLV